MVELTPFWAAFLFAIGALLIFLGIVGRGPADRDAFAPARARRDSLYLRLERRLRLAGMRETAPGFFVACLAATAAVAYGAVFFWTGSFRAGLIFIPLVAVGFFVYLEVRQRSYVRRTTQEMVPFLRKIEANVSAGRSAERSFEDAVNETRLIRQALAQSVLELRLNRPFVDVLRESVRMLPLRSWQQFVNQMELHQQAGGNLAAIISDSVAQINTLLQLQAELRADYSRFSKQQYILLVISIAVFPLLAAAGLLPQLVDTLFGLVALVCGVLLMIAGFAYARLQLKDIDRRLDF